MVFLDLRKWCLAWADGSLLPPMCLPQRAGWPHLPLAPLHDDQLLLGGRAGKDNLRVVLQDLVQVLGGHVLQIGAVDHAGFGLPRWRRPAV